MRLAAPANLPSAPTRIELEFHFPIPQRFQAKVREFHGAPHRVRPDWDNLAKGCCDALWGADACISDAKVVKRYAQGTGRTIVRVWE